MSSILLFDFNPKSSLKNWTVVDDSVMGGKSEGQFYLSPEGHGVFEGEVSLKNNGGFSSVRYNFKSLAIGKATKVSLLVKGDGKEYQLRLKANANDYYSYILPFSTSGEWQTIEIQLSDLYPSFRGRKLDQANFSHDHIEELAFLIGNKTPESFKLLIDKIELK